MNRETDALDAYIPLCGKRISQDEEVALIKLILAGQIDYWQYFQSTYQLMVMKYVNTYREGEFFYHETWARALNKLNTYDPGRAKFSTWLMLLCTTVIAEYFRNEARLKDKVAKFTGKVVWGAKPQTISEVLDRYSKRTDGFWPLFDSLLSKTLTDQEILLVKCYCFLSFYETGLLLGLSEEQTRAIYQGIVKKFSAAYKSEFKGLDVFWVYKPKLRNYYRV